MAVCFATVAIMLVANAQMVAARSVLPSQGDEAAAAAGASAGTDVVVGEMQTIHLGE